MTRRIPKIPTRIPIASLGAVRFTCKLGRRNLLSIGRRHSKVGRRTKRTNMCDLPADLVRQEILTRVPITSLRAVRSTCKLWDALTKEWILGRAAAAKEQFLGFMTKDSKVCSVRFYLCRNEDKKLWFHDLHDVSVKHVGLLNQIKISRVFHCDGLLLCVGKDHSRLLVWNPYLGQTKWITPRTYFHIKDWYALGYDINRNHKILRFLYYLDQFEIYELSSNSWRVLNVTSYWDISHYQSGVSVKGNTYFVALDLMTDETEFFLLCFDFTTEKFGQRLPLPFHSYCKDNLALSCVREEKLVVLYPGPLNHNDRSYIVQIWVTTTIEPNYVSWSKFLRVENKELALNGIWVNYYDSEGQSFFIDEEEKVAVIAGHNTAYIIGEDGYFSSVSLGTAPKGWKPCYKYYYPPLVCPSSYRPSLVQLNQPR